MLTFYVLGLPDVPDNHQSNSKNIITLSTLTTLNRERGERGRLQVHFLSKEGVVPQYFVTNCSSQNPYVILYIFTFVLSKLFCCKRKLFISSSIIFLSKSSKIFFTVAELSLSRSSAIKINLHRLA